MILRFPPPLRALSAVLRRLRRLRSQWRFGSGLLAVLIAFGAALLMRGQSAHLPDARSLRPTAPPPATRALTVSLSTLHVTPFTQHGDQWVGRTATVTATIVNGTGKDLHQVQLWLYAPGLSVVAVPPAHPVDTHANPPRDTPIIEELPWLPATQTRQIALTLHASRSGVFSIRARIVSGEGIAADSATLPLTVLFR